MYNIESYKLHDYSICSFDLLYSTHLAMRNSTFLFIIRSNHRNIVKFEILIAFLGPILMKEILIQPGFNLSTDALNCLSEAAPENEVSYMLKFLISNN
ncbi:hypothetical protein T05_8543 [Trichinella murrelli]|uniref:Uncharacterized protein n=1 Tax=Trichinella murrelli TaxID=144512 RepID=A0A0V0UD96_9BILA|nr:hypothetical protein T05_8543 [Trichinella murrelli]